MLLSGLGLYKRKFEANPWKTELVMNSETMSSKINKSIHRKNGGTNLPDQLVGYNIFNVRTFNNILSYLNIACRCNIYNIQMER